MTNDDGMTKRPKSAFVIPARRAGSISTSAGPSMRSCICLYARFWHKVLFDLGYLSKPEPFQRLVNQGMILGEDGRKMSKRWGNVIDPIDVIENLRRGCVSLLRDVHGPARANETVEHERGRRRLPLPRAGLASDHGGKPGRRMGSVRRGAGCRADESPAQRFCTPRSRKSPSDIETLSFNTAISQMMIFVNAFTNAPNKSVSALRTLLLLLNPFAPHLTSELWEILGEICRRRGRHHRANLARTTTNAC